MFDVYVWITYLGTGNHYLNLRQFIVLILCNGLKVFSQEAFLTTFASLGLSFLNFIIPHVQTVFLFFSVI